ncbi:ATP-binding protein, partial [Streptosporangium sp. NPDC048865]|uniref:sensor histidine kinase n=1 Tax=Streptosporangium sp. NPDC048865 TaxID=3155766 RepID=UPI003429FAA5
QAVNDIVHLVAELVENAIFFSPQDTKITVTSNGNEMGAVILAVTDSGIGMSDEELAEANRRLAEPPAVDLSVSRRMGLFVVGRLAMRHGIRVQLRRPDTGGLSAVVLLPVQVVAQSTVVPEMALSAQGMPSGSFGGPSGSFGSMSSMSGQDPFASVNPDPFGSAPNPDPFGTGRGGRPQAGAGAPPAQAPPQVPAPTSADLWSGPVVPASAVEDLWSSPMASTAPPSFPSAWPDPPAIDPWTPQTPQPPHRLEPMENTQALPVVEVPPTEPEPEEFLPIFAAVGSDWFRSSAAPEPEPEAAPEPVAEVRPRPLEQRVRRGPQGLETQNIPQITPSSQPPQQQSPPLPQRTPQPTQAQPLPQRTPQPTRQSRPAEPAAERQPWSTPSDQGWAAAEVAKKPVEGGVTGAGLPKRVPKANLVPGAASAAAAAPAPPMPPISAERVRSRLSSFQQGVRQGRAEMSERANAVEGENQQ